MSNCFGIFTSISGVAETMKINNLRRSVSTEVAERRNEEGKVIARQVYSRKETINFDGTLSTESLEPSAIEGGGTISIGGKDYLIETCEVVESNTNFATASVTASRVDSSEDTTYAASGTGSAQ